jgi:hypothetical protein
MVEQPNPKLLKVVMERDGERERRIHFQRAAHLLKVQNEQLRRQVQRLTRDHATAVDATPRLQTAAKA